jgi:hypothetical protein
MKGQSTLSTSVVYASLIVLWFALISHPLRKDDSDTFLQEIIPINVAIRLLVNPLRVPSKDNEFTDHDGSKSIYFYIRDNILAYDEKKAESVEKTNDPLSPLHKTMILMGCYGDMSTRNPEVDKQNILYPLIRTSEKEILPFDFSRVGVNAKFMSKSNRKRENAFMTNLILQALEDKNNEIGMSRGFRGSVHDRSTCDCMRDFAAPSVMEVGEDKDVCDTKSQDSCGVQNILDYALDGTDKDATTGTQAELQIMAPVSSTKSQKRNRKDPLLAQFETFFISKHTNTPGATAVLAKTEDLYIFLKVYCNIQGYENAVHPDLSDPEFQNRYQREQNRKCPPTMKDYFNDKPSAVEVTLVQARTLVHQLIQNAHAHNKLQAPYVKKTAPFQASKMPPEISYASYNHYISKYRAAFDTCDQIAVPSYITKVAGYTNSVHWQLLGYFMLLLAASVSFWWAYVIKYRAFEDMRMQTKSQNTNQTVVHFLQRGNECFSKVFYYLNFVLVLFAAFLCIVFMAMIVTNDFSFPRVESDDRYFFWAFALLFWILFLVMFVIVLGMIFYLAWKIYKDEFRGSTHLEYLNKMIFAAQIAMDVPVILGLTFIALGTAMQRGVGDFSLLATIMILFTIIGFTTHITNVLRIIDLIAQSRPSKDGHASKIKYNRVAIGLLITIMLYVSMYLAGLDSYQGDSYGVWYYHMFVFVGILILCISDLTLEVMCLFKVQKYLTPDQLVYTFLHQKAQNLAYIIIFCVFVLNFYTFITICQRSTPQVDRADVCNFFMFHGT